LARVVAVTFCQTLAASLAARFGPIPMAAFQTCLQVWLTSSLLADGLAVAVQVHKHFSSYYWFVKCNHITCKSLFGLKIIVLSVDMLTIMHQTN